VHTDLATPYVTNFGSDEQRARWLPKFATGELLTAIGVTEPDAGSDVAAIRTSARRDGDGWRLNGSKMFITNGAIADIVFVATNWEGTENALELAGKGNLAGKVVVDVTNPLKQGAAGPELALGFSDSGGEQVQRWLPDAKVVKAFNIVTAGTMVSPKREEGVPDMLIAGNDAAAKAKVTEILTQLGWPTIDLGGLVEVVRNGTQARQANEHDVGRPHPGVDEDDRPRCEVHAADHVQRADIDEGIDDVAEDARLWLEQVGPEGADHGG